MPTFLVGIFAALGANLFKLVALALAGAALLGGGYLWGDTHATAAAMEASAKAAQTQVAATAASYQTTINGYAAQLKAQSARGDQLAQELDRSRTQLAASTAAAKKEIAHDIPPDPVCDLDAAAVDVLRAQPARH